MNIQLFMIAEVFVLAFGLVLAIMRGLAGPVFLPLRIMSNAYTDIFRAIPGVLVIYLLGFGIPGLGLIDPRTDQRLFGIAALTLVYSAYVSEVYRAGIESIHPSQDAAARSLGLSRLQALRFVIVPQAVRRVIPPLLNDFIGLQKDTVLVSFIGVVEIFRYAQIKSAATYNFTPLMGVALVFIVVTIPLIHVVDWLVARDRRRAPVAPPGDRRGPAHRGPAQGVRRARGPARDRPRGRRARGRLPHRRIGIGQVHAPALRQPARDGRCRTDRRGGRGHHRGRRPSRPHPAAHRDRLPGLQPVPAHVGARQHHPRTTPGPEDAAGATAESQATELLERFGLADKRNEPPDRLSGGQQQRVAIVRALAMKPDLLLLDEVTSALDPELVAEVLNVIRELAASGMTMLIATHEMGFARDIADRVCFLDAGTIIEQGPPEQILSDPQEPRTRQFLQRIIEAGRL